MVSKSKRKQKNKFLKLLLSIVCVACMALSVVIPVNAVEANPAVTNVRNSIVQIRMVYKIDSHDKGQTIAGGTGFLINNNTLLTCAHVVEIDEDCAKSAKEYCTSRGAQYNVDNFSLVAVVSNDVTIPITVKKQSDEMDFAILNLTEAMNKRVPAVLGDSEKAQATQTVYALGFPSSSLQNFNSNTFTSSDVAITQGAITKNNSNYFGVMAIEHNADLNFGHSGGPLVDDKGDVLAINKSYLKDANGVLYSISINQIKVILDELGVEYQTAGVTTEPTTEEITDAATEATTLAPATVSEEPTDSKAEVPASADMTKTIIIIAIVVLVLIIIAIVIIIIISSNKKANKIPPVTGGTVTPNKFTPPQPPVPPYGGGSAPYRSSTMDGGSSNTMPSNDGAGETSVLNEGAGETTVLGYQAAGAVLKRVRNGENININKPEFVIGKERRRVDYCISDNNSISRTHAKIKARAGKFYIADLGSTNCTYVNGNKLSPNQEVALNKGDKIKISDEEFEFMG